MDQRQGKSPSCTFLIYQMLLQNGQWITNDSMEHVRTTEIFICPNSRNGHSTLFTKSTLQASQIQNGSTNWSVDCKLEHMALYMTRTLGFLTNYISVNLCYLCKPMFVHLCDLYSFMLQETASVVLICTTALNKLIFGQTYICLALDWLIIDETRNNWSVDINTVTNLGRV